MTTENQAGKLVATLPDELDDSRSQGRAGGGGEADQEDTYKDQTAEVVVFRQDDTALLSGEAQDDLIGGAWGRFMNSLDVVSRRTEGRHDGEVAAPIGEKPTGPHQGRFAGYRATPEWISGGRVL